VEAVVDVITIKKEKHYLMLAVCPPLITRGFKLKNKIYINENE